MKHNKQEKNESYKIYDIHEHDTWKKGNKK